MHLSQEYLLLVDGEGRVLGRESKEACHRGQGLLHAAFLVLVFDKAGSLLLARRSPEKSLWPGFWDGTVASHYLQSPDRPTRIREKVHQELGVEAADPEYRFRFQYQASYKDRGSECELCDVYVLKGVAPDDLRVNPAEISEFRTVDLDALKREIAAEPGVFTPWFLIVFQRLFGPDAGEQRPKSVS
ncbi:MAG: NUDIX domain-containing protein [Candidatus Aminicenantes bacterium]|nr:NUDIX domain-containing protein [Candidatus Aminicenantes bacterium]